MTDQPKSEQAIQAGPPDQPSEQAIQAGPPGPTLPPEPTPRDPDVIPLPPLPPAPTLAPMDQGWAVFEGILLLLVATFCFFLGSFAITTTEFWLRLATGRAIANGEPLGVDPFSFGSVHNGVPVPWVNHSWLYDLGLYHLYTAFGGAGVVIVHAALMVVLLLILMKLRPEGSSRLAAMLLAGLTALVVSQRLLPSPLMMSYLSFGLMFLLLARGGALGGSAEEETPSPRPLWGLPLLFALWVNLDAWFFLGLATLALVVLGGILASALGWNDRASPVTQIAVLVASGAACLLNPYGWQVYTLPAEAGFVFGAWLPQALDGGAETLRGFDTESLISLNYVGPFHRSYWPFTPQSFFVVNVAFFFLLLLSMVSVVLRIVSGFAMKGSGLPLGRLLAWGLLTYLAMMQIRLIPLFAVVAGPVTMLNFADFGRWRRSRDGVAQEPIFHAGLARLVGAMLALIALGLAWPGWLHARIGASVASRRVAWHVQEDPSLRSAAEALKRAQAKHVFNYSFDIANYCAWFAPGVRCYVDQRLALYRHEASRYAKAKKALVTTATDILKQSPVSSARRDWIDAFHDHAIDHLAMSKSIFAPEILITQMCWLDPKHWIHEYVDGRGGVFAWSAEGNGDPLALHNAWLREAFGPVPEGRRVPRPADTAAAPETTALSLYLKGQPPVLSPNVTAPLVYRIYFDLIRESWPRAYVHAQTVGIWTAPAGLGAVAPGSTLLPYTLMTSPFFMPPRFHARDAGPVAAPLLAMRQARRAVLEHPQEPRGYSALHLACRIQGLDVEEYWVGRDKSERANIRRMQIAMAFRTYLDLRPDDWRVRLEFADFLHRDYLLDAALEQIVLSAQSVEKERRQTADKKAADGLKAQEKQLAAFTKKIELDVKRRRTDFDIRSARRKPLEKYDIAFQAAYRTVDDRNQEIYDEKGMGLPLEGLKQLDSVNPSELKPEEKTAVRFFRFRLLMQLGRVGEAVEELDFIENPQLADQGRLLYYAAVGNYELMDQTIARMEEITERAVPLAPRRASLRNAVAGLISLSAAVELPVTARVRYIEWSSRPMVDKAQEVQQLISVHANSRTLRGLCALEAGDTAKAAELFAEALRVGGPEGRFIDRPIAQRYLELLSAQKR